MTDKELLELAAKAANDKNIREDYHGSHFRVIGECEDGSLRMVNWNPLTDNGDAFRLAVKLKIDVEHKLGGYLGLDFIVSASYGSIYCEEHYELSPDESHRRAIVLAAAEIGKGMK